ncbi:GNAT family N-acetyltransferase [Deinococcus aquaticus]|uniref:GNAT family N-acetyltransferase n=1 Tax=Deinococcus aquaticus TaxID=328692 RepID=UPI003F4507C4
MTPNLSFTTGDAQAASAVLTASAAQLQARGRTLWPPDRLTPEHLQRHYPPGGWHVAWTDATATSEPVGCFCLLTSDPPFWPHDPPGEALYLHKLAVHPSAQGQGLAHTLLQEAARVTVLAGRPWLKLDTDAARPALHHLYDSFGFERCGQRDVFGLTVILYRLPVRRAGGGLG